MHVSIKRQHQSKPVQKKPLSWSELRALAKKQGVNVFGKTREQIEREIQG